MVEELLEQETADPIINNNISLSSLSKKEKIANRVKERNSWTTFKKPNELTFIGSVLPKYLKYYYTKHPTEEDLNQSFPVKLYDDGKIDFDALRSPPSSQIQATWIGHSTILVQMGGLTMLTDPVFSQRCSMSQMSGPKRFRPPPFSLKQLIIKERIAIDIVLISHNHYDHLDYYSVKKIAKYMLGYSNNINPTSANNSENNTKNNDKSNDKRGVKFIVPLGLKAWFKRKVPKSLMGNNSVVELDWHEKTIHTTSLNSKTNNIFEHGNSNGLDKMDNDIRNFDCEHSSSFDVTVTAIPMQHWSNRYGWDRDKTLWCGFSVVANARAYSTPKSLDEKDIGDSDNSDGKSTDKITGDHSTNRSKTELKFLFPGDTGWFDGLYKIGEQYGPFDLAALPIGVYTPEHFMKPMHMSPDDAVRMMTAIQAKKAVPIHWGTFCLAAESIVEPKERLKKALETADIDQSTFPAWFIGDTITSG